MRQATEKPDVRRIAATFTGRVQGVGFRATVREIAAALPVSGWVRNEPDGSVKMQAQGTGEAVDALLARISTERAAHVVSIDVMRIEPVLGEVGFCIVR